MRFTTLIGMGLLCAARAGAEGPVECQSFLLPEPPAISWVQRASAPLASFTRRDLAEALNADHRLGLLKLTEASPTLDRLDHFTSPALVHTVVLDQRRSRVFEEYLKAVLASSHAITDGIRREREVPPHVELLLTLIESRYRAALEIVGFAMATKTGQRPRVKASAYVRALQQTLVTVVNELRAHRTYRAVFADFDFRDVDWSAVASQIERSLSTSPLLAFNGMDNSRSFTKRFLGDIQPDRDVIVNLEAMGSVLGHRLEELPVGILHRTADALSSVRFGRYLFFGYEGDYRSAIRLKYIRSRVGDSTTIEVTLKLSTRQKKTVGVKLDREHQNLDPLFGLSQPRGRHLHTCGSYASTLFLKCGVGILSPAYLTPGAVSLSLFIQKHLRVGTVESARIMIVKDLKRVPKDLGIIVFHEIGPMVAEFAVYLGALKGLDSLISSML